MYKDIHGTAWANVLTILLLRLMLYIQTKQFPRPHSSILAGSIMNMTNYTVEKWLDLAPCPPPHNPGLLYRTPYPVNLTVEEVGKIAQRCKVSPRAQLLAHDPPDPPEAWLYIVVFLGLTVIVLVIGFMYRYLHNRQRTSDSCRQSSVSKHRQLEEEMQDRSGCVNHNYKSSQQDLQ